MRKKIFAPKFAQEAGKFPLLSQHEEGLLAQRMVERGDERAKDCLAKAHLRLVYKIANENSGYCYRYGIDPQELCQTGTVGLMKALQKFDPERGFRVSTYAMWWIQAEIREYIYNSHGMVKLPFGGERKKLFFGLSSAKAALGIMDAGRELRVEEVAGLAQKLDVSVDIVTEMNRRLFSSDTSLNRPANPDDPDSGEIQDLIPSGEKTPEEIVSGREEENARKEILKKALAALSERDKDILTKRRLQDRPVTLEALGAKYGISRERVRQLEDKAFAKVEKAIRDDFKKAAIGAEAAAREHRARKGRQTVPATLDL